MDYNEFKQKSDDCLKEIYHVNERLWKDWGDLITFSSKLGSIIKQFETYPYYKRQLEPEVEKLHKCWSELSGLAAAVEVTRSTISGRIAFEPEGSTHKLLGEK